MVFPELSLVGYSPLDLMSRPSWAALATDQLERFHAWLADEFPKLGVIVGTTFSVKAKSLTPRGIANCAVFLHGKEREVRAKTLLPDYDVFAIDAAATTPAIRTQFSGAGTTLFNMAVNPADGRVFVSNTEAFNEVRFEGSGSRGNSTVRGRLAESRVSIVNTSTNVVVAVRLNPHVDFKTAQGASVPAADKARSLAQPTALAFNPSGDTIYAAAFGSAKVAALPTAALVAGTYAPVCLVALPPASGLLGTSGVLVKPDNSDAGFLTYYPLPRD